MIGYFARHPTAANLLMLAIMALGLAMVPSLKRETFPDFTPSQVQVNVVYPGASAEEVEEALCQRLEEAVEGVSDVEEVICQAQESSAAMVVEMRDGGNLDRFLAEVKTEVEAIDDFPEVVEAPVIRQLNLTDTVVVTAVAGPMAEVDLKAYVEGLKDRLLRQRIAAKVDIQGFSDHQIRIEVDALTLRQLGLSVADLADRIERQSLDLPSGAIETDQQEILVRFTGEGQSVRDFERMLVLGAESGAEVRLGEIATIRDRFEDDEVRLLLDGRRAAMLDVQKAKAADTLVAMANLNAFLDDERARAPPGIEFVHAINVSSIVEDRLDMVIENGAQGLLLVLLVMIAFFGLRYAFWVAAGLPVSFLGAIVVMAWLGYSINMITLVGLLIAIGLLMDDAIVIAENIATKLERGLAPFEAAIDGAREVAPGVVASFLTTAAVFGPLAFLSGEIGKVLRVLPVVLIVTLTVSLIEAFLILPNHLAHAGAANRPGRFRQAFERRFDEFRTRVFGPLVDAAVAFRYLTIGIAILLLLLAVAILAAGFVKFRAFPELDGDYIQAQILLPEGTPLARTEAVVHRLVATLEDVNQELTSAQPGGRALVENVIVEFGTNQRAGERGSHVATVTAALLAAEERTTTIDELVPRWRAAVGDLPDVISIVYQQPFRGPGGDAISLRLVGGDLDELKAAALDLQRWLADYPGVVDLTDDLRPGKPERRFTLRDGASALGLDAAMIANQLRAAFFGATAREIQVGPESYEIDVRLAEAERRSLGDLEHFTVTGPGGVQVPLSAVTDVEEGRGWARIQRIDGQRAVTVTGDVEAGTNASEIVADTQARFIPDLEARFPGIRLSLEGQAREAAETGTSMAQGFGLGLIAVFLVLSFVFRSYLEPFVVMSVIPFAIVGVVFGHLALGLDLSLPSMLGFVSLAGIVVNDSILLVAFIKQHHDAGETIEDAARLAARARFRAVLLTSITTIVGLLPLLSETSLQAQVLVPLVTSLAFGLLASTILVLLTVPALYTILSDFNLTTLARRAAAPTPPLDARRSEGST